MLAAERRARLSEIVRATGVASTEQLASVLDVSAETIRRDLLVLEKRGDIVRVHGGATARPNKIVTSEPSFETRSVEEQQRKRRIAKVAASQIVPGGMAFIDVGTTALFTARELSKNLSATIVTVSLRVALELSEYPSLEVIVVGGRVRGGDLAVAGAATCSSLREMHFDVSILGSGALDASAGLTDYHAEEVESRRVVLANSARSYVLADATKFNKVARFHVAGFDQLTGVIVDSLPDGRLADAIDASGAALIGPNGASSASGSH